MAITIPTDDEISARALAFLRNRLPGKDTGTESFFGKLARADAKLAWLIMQAVANADADAVPTSRTSSGRLDEFAEAFGVPTDTAGVYGRKSATVAKGLQGTITGTKGNILQVSDGTATASDGTTTFVLTAPVTIPGSGSGNGSVTGTWDATTAGSGGNLRAGDTLTISNPTSGIDATVILTAGPSTLGLDRESDTALLSRIYVKLQTPPRGGSSADYRAWAEAVSGVYRAYPYPHRNGVGSMHLVITANGSGKGRDPGATVSSEVGYYINGYGLEAIVAQRSVTVQGFTIHRPRFVTTGLLIRTRLTPAGQSGSSRYAFDWTDTAATYTVSSYVAGPPAVLTISQDAPATLTAAVDAGTKPRLQVLITTTGANATPYQARVTAYGGAGNRQLTLENPLPTGWVTPTAGDSVFSGGPMVEPVAAAILEYVDSLGPARGSYAEALDFWESTCAIARLTQIALAAEDSDGTRFASNIVTDGVTISYNGAGALVADVTAGDTALATAPELLYVKPGGIAVTQ